MIKEQHTVQTTTQHLEQLRQQLAVRWLTWIEKREPACLFPNKSHGDALAARRLPSPLVANMAQLTGVSIHVAHRST